MCISTYVYEYTSKYIYCLYMCIYTFIHISADFVCAYTYSIDMICKYILVTMRGSRLESVRLQHRTL